MKIKKILIITLIIGISLLYILPWVYSTFFKEVEKTIPIYDDKGRQIVG